MHDDPQGLPSSAHKDDGAAPPRRHLISFAGAAMTTGLVAGYGAFAYIAVRFLQPDRSRSKGWMFVAPVHRIRVGGSMRYRTPDGRTVNITRSAAAPEAASFRALSSVCPHLGCQVHWEPQNERYFCPCHNGVFDPTGRATGGPPAEAGQSLPTYPLKVENDLLYIEVALQHLASAGPTGHRAAVARCEPLPPPRWPRGPGHDPCLAPEATSFEPRTA